MKTEINIEASVINKEQDFREIMGEGFYEILLTVLNANLLYSPSERFNLLSCTLLNIGWLLL